MDNEYNKEELERLVDTTAFKISMIMIGYVEDQGLEDYVTEEAIEDIVKISKIAEIAIEGAILEARDKQEIELLEASWNLPSQSKS